MIFPKIVFFFASVAIVSGGWAAIDLKVFSQSYWEHNDFVRVSEYFTRKENTSNRIILRTQEESRAGFYFFIEIESNNLALKASDLSLELKVLDSVSIDAKNYQFALPIQVFRKGKFLLGLTGEDWPNRKIQPLAWYLRVYSKDGETVASTQSFLWSHQ